MFYNNRWYSEQDSLTIDLKNWFSSEKGWKNTLISLDSLFDGANANTTANISPNVLAEIYQTWAANAFNAVTGTREYPLGIVIHLGASKFNNTSIPSTGWAGTTLEAKELLTKDSALGGLNWVITDGGEA
jgi:hypothetical protein